MSENKEKLAEDLVKEMTKRINENAEMLENWGKTFQLVFSDINVGYLFTITMKGEVGKVEKAIRKEDAIVTLTQSTDTLKDIFDGKLTPIAAAQMGKVTIDGPLMELAKLQVIF